MKAKLASAATMLMTVRGSGVQDRVCSNPIEPNLKSFVNTRYLGFLRTENTVVRILQAVNPVILEPALAVDACKPLVHVVDGVAILLLPRNFEHRGGRGRRGRRGRRRILAIHTCKPFMCASTSAADLNHAYTSPYIRRCARSQISLPLSNLRQPSRRLHPSWMGGKTPRTLNCLID